MKKQRLTIGAFLSIQLSTNQYAYARILDNAAFAIYDFITQEVNTDLHSIANKPVLFIVSVYDYAVTSGRWKKLGKLQLEDSFRTLPMKFIQDALLPDRYSLYNPNTGDIKDVNKDECIGLERAAVWEPEHVESRISDYYAGKPNIWVDQLRLK